MILICGLMFLVGWGIFWSAIVIDTYIRAWKEVNRGSR